MDVKEYYMTSGKNILTLALITLVVTSCVTGKKYGNLENKNQYLLTERDSLKAENLFLSMSNRELEAKTKKLAEDAKEVNSKIDSLNTELTSAQDEVSRLNTRYNELQNAQEDMVRGNAKESQRMLEQLRAAQDDLQKKEAIMNNLEANLDAKKTSLDELTNELEKRNARLNELERMLDAQQKAVKELKAKVSDALYGFEGKGLTVSMKNGQVYVSLDEKLLFRSGSYDIDATGRSALKKLGTLLEKNPDITITIEGHTDDVPYHSGSGLLVDNWDLSVKRATTVVRALTEDTNLNPKRLIASGRSEFIPVDQRDTPEARQKNRRTEIILTPDLSSLYKILENY